MGLCKDCRLWCQAEEQEIKNASFNVCTAGTCELTPGDMTDLDDYAEEIIFGRDGPIYTAAKFRCVNYKEIKK